MDEKLVSTLIPPSADLATAPPTPAEPLVNKQWTKVIPMLNIFCLVISLLLLFGLDLMILLSASPTADFLDQGDLFVIWIIMLAVFAVFLLLFYFENFRFKKSFADSRSGLDNWIVVIVVIRNLLVLGSSTPFIHLLVWFFGWAIALPLMIIYLLLLWRRSKAEASNLTPQPVS